MNKKRMIILIGIIIVILDQLSKMLILNKEITVVPNFLNFIYTQNVGMAFGIGSSMFATITNAIVIVSILIFLVLKRKKLEHITYYSLILILAGGIGNLIDRIFRGYVIDFIDINLFNFPNFNIADMSIVIGVIIIFIMIINSIKEAKSNFFLI